jgi:hypothetical protein
MRHSGPKDTHERFRDDERVHSSSDRSFGLVFTAIFALAGLWPLFRGRPPRGWALAIALAFLGTALVKPGLLAPLNRLWLGLGLLLHAIVSPMVMGVLFFGTVTPTSWIMRILGKDPLRLRSESDAPTYWIERRPPGPKPDTMPRQF